MGCGNDAQRGKDYIITRLNKHHSKYQIIGQVICPYRPTSTSIHWDSGVLEEKVGVTLYHFVDSPGVMNPGVSRSALLLLLQERQTYYSGRPAKRRPSEGESLADRDIISVNAVGANVHSVEQRLSAYTSTAFDTLGFLSVSSVGEEQKLPSIHFGRIVHISVEGGFDTVIQK